MSTQAYVTYDEDLQHVVIFAGDTAIHVEGSIQDKVQNVVRAADHYPDMYGSSSMHVHDDPRTREAWELETAIFQFAMVVMSEDDAQRLHYALQLLFETQTGRTLVHSLRVAQAVANESGTVAQIALALLHDVYEDDPTDETMRNIIEAVCFASDCSLGDAEAHSAILAVTRHPEEPYSSFIERSARNDIGALVKLCDVRDNLHSPGRDSLKPRYSKAERVLATAFLKQKGGIR